MAAATRPTLPSATADAAKAASKPVATACPRRPPCRPGRQAGTSPTRRQQSPVHAPLQHRVADPIVPGHFDAKSGNYVYDTGALTTLKLANGGNVTNVGVNSTESNLYRFLIDPQTSRSIPWT